MARGSLFSRTVEETDIVPYRVDCREIELLDMLLSQALAVLDGSDTEQLLVCPCGPVSRDHRRLADCLQRMTPHGALSRHPPRSSKSKKQPKSLLLDYILDSIACA